MIGVNGASVCLCDWEIGDRVERTLRRMDKYLTPFEAQDALWLIEETQRQLDEYFSGNLRKFDLPIKAFGTDFQRRVWQALLDVPYGRTAHYKDIAAIVGLPHGVRAVASAIGANPLSILVPCHRVIGSDGSLTGYAGGLGAKSYLLQLESRIHDISDEIVNGKEVYH